MLGSLTLDCYTCNPSLKCSRIIGNKVQTHIGCVRGRQVSTVFNSFRWFSIVFNCFKWFSVGFNGFQQFSTVLVAYMRSIHRDVVCEPNQWATWLACSLNMWLTHCSLCLVQTGLFSCKISLKYSRINGNKIQSHIECVKGRWLLTVFNSFQWS